MKRVTVLFYCLMILIAGAPGQNLPELSPRVQGELNLLENWISEQMDYYHIPGLAAALVYDQQLVWYKSFGVADLESGQKINEHTLFRIASISKTFTSTAIMQLRDAGKLRLDDPVKKYLPWFELENPFKGAPDITIRQLLTHTSGIPREAAYPYWTDHNFPTLEQIRKKLPQQEQIFYPETRWKYSNLGMALLGYVVEAAGGQKYADYIHEHILQPLGMRDTRVRLSARDREMLATGYLRYLPDSERKEAPFTDARGLTPAANLASTVADLARYLALQFRYDSADQNPVLKGSTLREMHRVHWLRDNWTSGWGLGFGVTRKGDRTIVGHGGWVAGYRSHILFSPKEKLGVVVLMNTEDFSPYKFAVRILEQAGPAVLNELAPPQAAPLFDEQWQKYTGRYMDTSFWQTDVLMKDRGLYMYGRSYPPTDEPQSALVQLFYESENTFRKSGPGGNGERVVFELSNGKVSRIKDGENYLYPVLSR